MINDKFISDRLKKLTTQVKLGFFKHKYGESHRFYHNWNHVVDLLNKAMKDDCLNDNLFLAILFHDFIYNSKATDNEEKSASLFKIYFPDNNIVYRAILNTKTHTGDDETSKLLNKYDVSILYDDFSKFIEYEHKIFKEYKFVDINTYKTKRIEFLNKNFPDINKKYIDYIKYSDYSKF